MTFCANCGFPITGKYCGQCGTAAGPPPRPVDPEDPPFNEPLPDNAAAALAYMLGPITAALFLSLDPYSQKPFVRFHAWQSMLFSCSVGVLYMFLMVIAFLSPLLGIALLAVAGVLVFALLVLWLFVMWQTFAGRKFLLPVIGPMAEKCSFTRTYPSSLRIRPKDFL